MSAERSGEAELARAHACPQGCPACTAALEEAAAAEEQARRRAVPARLADYADFVRSDDARRMTNLSLRSGRPFPVMTDDEVVQVLIEEACFERAYLAELIAKREAVQASEAASGDPDLDDALSKARHFAQTGEPS